MHKPPSCPERGDKARGAAIRLGATPLEALIVGEVAAYGAICWLKDAELAADITQRNGRNPHPRSVARARRNAARQGLLISQRLGAGKRCPGKARPVTYGTTAKIVVFGPRFGMRDPLRRGDRRRLHAHLAALNEEMTPAVSTYVRQPGQAAHSCQPSMTTSQPPMAAELAEIIAKTADALEAKADREHAAEDRRMMDAVHALRRQGRGPPE
jgi:hypothetical protein